MNVGAWLGSLACWLPLEVVVAGVSIPSWFSLPRVVIFSSVFDFVPFNFSAVCFSRKTSNRPNLLKLSVRAEQLRLAARLVVR